MSSNRDLLVEIGCEELPPKSLDALRDALFDHVTEGLQKARLGFDLASSRSFSTPRRLALLLSEVDDTQPDQTIERRGPALAAAFDAEGQPTKAAQGFARSLGLTVDELGTLENDKGKWLHASVSQPGKPLGELLFPILEEAIRKLPIPRPMRWANHDYSFVRPVHWLVVLHGTAVVSGTLFGLESGNLTQGHRIHAPGPHEIPQADQYLAVLEQARVIADPLVRAERIAAGLREADDQVRIDSALLAEVNNLVEWPVAVACAFEKGFLEVPHEALIASMQEHQKFFPVNSLDNDSGITNRFVAIANIESTDVAAVRTGFERVIRPRLADARFFLEQDLRQPLQHHLSTLDRVVFQEKIGTIGDKTKRIVGISRKLADDLDLDVTAAMRAAELSKCDLMTLMVGEFPELQGVMGRHYALVGGEPEAVAMAIEEHYRPRFAGDDIPASEIGAVVSIADRLDSLLGIFAGVGQPSGSRDPFALRRAALGLVRILLEARIDLPLNRLLAVAANQLSEGIEIQPSLLADVREFIIQRLRTHFGEQGFSSELLESALGSDWDSLLDLQQRLEALSEFMQLDESESLAQANKRSGNILRQAGVESFDEIDEDRLESKQETALFDAISNKEREVLKLTEARDYAGALASLATLKGPLDDFFDAVMVMDPDPVLRGNRLAMLHRMKSLFDRIGDLSVLG